MGDMDVAASALERLAESHQPTEPTLRDRIAIAAMQALLTAAPDWDDEHVSATSYRQADCMLAERVKAPTII